MWHEKLRTTAFITQQSSSRLSYDIAQNKGQRHLGNTYNTKKSNHFVFFFAHLALTLRP